MNVAPFQFLERFFHLCDEVEIPKTTKRFMELAQKFSIEGHGGSLSQITDFGTQFLDKICSAYPEGYLTWDYLRDFMLQNSNDVSGLVEFHSWGIFSELLVERLAEEYKCGNYSIKLTEPWFGLELVNGLVDDNYEFINLSNVDFGWEDDST